MPDTDTDTYAYAYADTDTDTDTSSVHRVYIFGMVCLRHKRPTDQDSDGQHPCRMHGDALNSGSVDPGMHATADTYTYARSMHLYIFSMVRMSDHQQADEDSCFELTGGMYRNAAVDADMQLRSADTDTDTDTSAHNYRNDSLHAALFCVSRVYSEIPGAGLKCF